MVTHTSLTATPLVAVAALLLFLGYRIRVGGDVHLIAGYQPGRVRDPAGLGAWVGGILRALGVMALGAAIALLLRPDIAAVIMDGWGVLVVASVVAVIVGARRYYLG